jgi:prevent-host-death family protein
MYKIYVHDYPERIASTMTTTSVSRLRQNLQTYLALAAAGQRIRITAHGRPVADITPLPANPTRRMPRASACVEASLGSAIQ